ncbi:MAG: hypothetical protein AB7O96_03145 [Pseudobdellovibrionaceae bacterium]
MKAILFFSAVLRVFARPLKAALGLCLLTSIAQAESPKRTVQPTPHFKIQGSEQFSKLRNSPDFKKLNLKNPGISRMGGSTTGGGCFLLNPQTHRYELIDIMNTNLRSSPGDQIPSSWKINLSSPKPYDIRGLRSWQLAIKTVQKWNPQTNSQGNSHVYYDSLVARALVAALNSLRVIGVLQDTQREGEIVCDVYKHLGSEINAAGVYVDVYGLAILPFFNQLSLEQQAAFWIHEAARFIQIDMNRDQNLENQWVLDLTKFVVLNSPQGNFETLDFQFLAAQLDEAKTYIRQLAEEKRALCQDLTRLFNQSIMISFAGGLQESKNQICGQALGIKDSKIISEILNQISERIEQMRLTAFQSNRPDLDRLANTAYDLYRPVSDSRYQFVKNQSFLALKLLNEHPLTQSLSNQFRTINR